MKIKNLLLGTIVTTMALTACEKSEDTGAPKDQMPKSVTITLPNINTTRATGDAMAASAVELRDFKVFFLNSGGEEQEVPKFNNADQKTYFTGADVNLGLDGQKITYHFLPAATTQVVVIGNLGKADLTYAQAIAANYDVLNDTAEGNPLYPLYGQADLKLKSGAEGFDDRVEGHTNVYEAKVKLAPQVSRFEIFGFGYLPENDTTPCTYGSLELAKIALGNYSTTYNLKSGDAVDAAVECPADDPSQMWDWINADRGAWTTAIPESVKTVEQNAKIFVKDGADFPADQTIQTIGESYTGQVISFGLAKNTLKPELLLSFYGVNGETKTPHYVRGKFTDLTFAPGKIYRVYYPITDKSWEDPQRCVELTVTVQNWTIEVVTPTFPTPTPTI